MKRLLTEPLVHFLALGAVLFALYGLIDRGESEAPVRQVRITAGDVAWLRTTWARQWAREPTDDELRGLVAELLKEELLAREAREMKLDENDTVVRRRLAQKLQFLVQDVSRRPEPMDEELRRFYGLHPEWFQSGPRVSFKHIFFSRQRRSNATGDAENVLLQLSEGGANAGDLGDPLMLEAEMHDADSRTVAALFGAGFAKALLALAPGAWHGPLESAYGVHLVYLSQLKPAVQPELAAVRAQLLERWREEASRNDYEKYLTGIREKYVIVADESIRSLVAPPRSGGNASAGTAD
jgi:hypothetical protein